MAEAAAILGHAVLPFCHAVLTEPWDAPAGRRFLAYRTRHGYRGLLGQGVVDEFATVSGPLFLAPEPLLGKLYDAGLALGVRRDPELPIDAGWPPFCAALDTPAPALPPRWDVELSDALRRPAWHLPETSTERRAVRLAAGRHALEVLRFGSRRERRVTVLGTDAPLLPAQLARLCDLDDAGLTIALATGNRLAAAAPGTTQSVAAVAEATLATLTEAVSRGLATVAAT